MFEMSPNERKLAAVMIAELTESGHTIQQTTDIVEEVILRYRSLREKLPGPLLLRFQKENRTDLFYLYLESVVGAGISA